MSGNNKKALQIVRISFPLFDNLSTTMQAGQKYFFPEHPEIDKRLVVGIEAHCAGTGSSGEGDAQERFKDGILIEPGKLASLFLNFYNNTNESIFENVPGLFLYNKFSSSPTVKFKLSIQPFFAKLKTRNCFVQLPGNFPSTIVNRYLSLTFYLR
jgi:hypothetical protein